MMNASEALHRLREVEYRLIILKDGGAMLADDALDDLRPVIYAMAELLRVTTHTTLFVGAKR